MGVRNHVNFIGRITKDPELKASSNNKGYVSFTLAVQREYKVKGSSDYEVDFLDFMAWGYTAKYLANYAKQGDMIAVVGEARVSVYDRDGVQTKSVTFNVSKTQILGSVGGSADELEEEQTTKTNVKNNTTTQTQMELENQDDVPF